MSRGSTGKTTAFTYLFGMVLGITILVWILRGVKILSFIPGGVIWVLFLLSVGIGIINWQLQRRQGRY